jgi:DNA invertase Pin-like site-specific DNA recombinase
VGKLDRLGRSLRDLIAMLDGLRDRRIKIQSLTEAIDTRTPTGRAMWQMIGVLAELERSLIVERTQAGMTEARRRGAKFGRKKNLGPVQITKAGKLIEAGERVEDAAVLWNVGRTTLYRSLA